jgi:hypothetical protein
MAENDRVTADAFRMRESAKALKRLQGELDSVRIGVDWLKLRLDPADPVQVHPLFLPALARFREAWAAELGHTADVTGHVGARLVATADGMETADRLNREAARRLQSGADGTDRAGGR